MRRPTGRRFVTALLIVVGVLVVALIGYAIGNQQAGSPTSEQSVPTAMSPAGSASRDALTEGGAPQDTSYLAAPDSEDAKTAAEGGSSGVSAGEALIIRNAAMEVRVEDVDGALDALRSAVSAAGGEIAEMSVSAGDLGAIPLEGGQSQPSGPSVAYATIRVPAEELAELQTKIGAFGTVLSQSSSASDVTEQAIDLEARLKNLRAEEARLRSLFNRTADVEDLLAVERELARVRGEIESMVAQLTYLQRQAARATLTVTLSEPGPVVEPGGASWGLREAIRRGVQATATLLSVAVTVAIPLAIFGAIALLLWLPIRALLRRRTARKATETRNITDTEDAEDGDL